MRASELCGLRLRDLDPGGGILYARGKGDKERAIPYMGAPRRAVEEYIAEYRPQLDKNRAEWLFLSRNGKQLHRETLWGDPAQTRRGRRSAGRSGSIRTVLRHTFATVLHTQRHGPEDASGNFSGHSSIMTTEKYTHLDISLRDYYDKYHPRAK